MIKKIGIIANIEKYKILENVNKIQTWITNKGFTIFLEKAIAQKIGNIKGYNFKKIANTLDLVIVLGGDGTLLMTARIFCKYNIPILGINLGSLGFLTVINLNEIFLTLENIFKGYFFVEKRMMLDIFVYRKKKIIKKYTVLNDAVVNRANIFRLLELKIILNNEYLTTYKADGLIIATPTGSTAYSLSAGGPIVLGQHNCIIINPICPHTLTNRPIIIPETSKLKIISSLNKKKGQGEIILSLDGQIFFNLKKEDIILIEKSKFYTQLITSSSRNYLEILRSKLGWGGSIKSANTIKKTGI